MVVVVSAIKFQFTLPRGERLVDVKIYANYKTFQFTLPRGERPAPLLSFSSASAFQFTLPRGERLIRRPPHSTWKGFNSRSRGGSDPPAAPPSSSPTVSIHAPAGGATSCKRWVMWLA